MIISSDITRLFPFREALEIKLRMGAKMFYSLEVADNNPAFTLQLIPNVSQQISEIKIQRYCKRGAVSASCYKTVFDGEINHPIDLKKLLELTKIIKS